VNAFVGVVPDHLQPRRLTTLLSNLRPSGPLASTLHSHFTSLSLSDSRKPVFPSYSLTLPRTVFFSIWPSHSFGTTSTIFNFVFFSQERAPSALAAVGNICSPYTLFINQFQPSFSRHTFRPQSYSARTTRHILSTAGHSFRHSCEYLRASSPLRAMTAGTTRSAARRGVFAVARREMVDGRFNR
jgi:hypothetical protein